jgi:hypothetical protein
MSASGRWQSATTIDPRIASLLRDLEPLQEAVTNHEVYERLDDLASVRVFMEHHVFAVLDFMWLLKALQRALTCVDVPWLPVGTPATRRFINEIVLSEESDVSGSTWISHFELYRQAMSEAGGECHPIDRYIERLQNGEEPLEALAGSGVPPAAERFVAATWRIVSSGDLPALAGAFAIGRENLIPSMFTSLMSLQVRVPTAVATLVDYLQRHIDLDGEVHTPLAFGMLVGLCESAPERWEAARAGAEVALRSRVSLWDGACRKMEALSMAPA